VVCLLEPRPVRRPEMFFDNLGNFNEGRSVAAQCHDKSNVLYWIRVTTLESICCTQIVVKSFRIREPT
jgi:hypothetical protein